MREGDYILFTHEGGVDVGDVDAKAYKLLIPVGKDLPPREEIKNTLLSKVQPEKQDVLVDFLIRMYSVYVGELLFLGLPLSRPCIVVMSGMRALLACVLDC